MIFDTSPTNLSNHNLKVRGQVSENPVNLITQAGSHLRDLPWHRWAPVLFKPAMAGSDELILICSNSHCMVFANIRLCRSGLACHTRCNQNQKSVVIS